MKEESEYTEAEIKEIQTRLYKDLRRDAMEKLKRIEFHIRSASEFSTVGYLEGMNFVMDDLEEVLLNWEV